MFSGIVEGLEKAVQIKKSKQSMEVTLPIPKGWKIQIGESISVDGVCSTIIKKVTGKTFSVYYMLETLRKTHLSYISAEHLFNFERSLTLNSLVGGHLVSGHIDTIATVYKTARNQGSVVLTFKIDPSFARYIIYKGSIAVNGVSLTIVAVDKNSFTVSLIPYTLQHTNLGSLRTHDTVNIEVDMMAKYIEKLLNKKS